ncbi:phage holin family protein [Lactobacillus mellis]|uniref:phage holin family protein n=1 Tax=Bombilactobacillus mellis TaxID=1218508 RepID=UPI0015811797|nr:phage holin family protein [Bombilactobacillus mellis]NUG66268.1 phage holin family protein [Bombilactobacillus mellis]
MKIMTLLMNYSFDNIRNFFSWYLGGLNDQLCALIIFITISYLTKIICKIDENKFSIQVSLHEVSQKLLIIVLVGFSNILDIYVFHDGSIIRAITISYYIFSEGNFILKNISQLGLVIPTTLKDILQNPYDKDNKNKKK